MICPVRFVFTTKSSSRRHACGRDGLVGAAAEGEAGDRAGYVDVSQAVAERPADREIPGYVREVGDWGSRRTRPLPGALPV